MCFGAFFMVNGEELDKESKIKLTSLQLRGIREFPVWGFLESFFVGSFF